MLNYTNENSLMVQRKKNILAKFPEPVVKLPIEHLNNYQKSVILELQFLYKSCQLLRFSVKKNYVVLGFFKMFQGQKNLKFFIIKKTNYVEKSIIKS